MTDLAVSTPPSSFAPTSYQELVQFADQLARTNFVPKDYRGNPAAIIFAVQMGAEVGLNPAHALLAIALIEGRAAMFGDAPLSVVRRSGKLAEIKEWWTGSEANGDWTAHCATLRVGASEHKITTFSMADAQRAGLWGRKSRDGGAMPWSAYPQRMLMFRARGWNLRDNFGDVLMGIAIGEEVEDAREVNVTPGPQATGNEALRQRMAEQMGAGGIAREPTPPPVEGIVEDPHPDFTRMLAEQVSETLEQEGMRRGIDAATYRDIVTQTLKGDRERRRPLNRETAVEVWRALQAWEPPVPEPTEDAEPTLL